ncbi:class I SAM-dependent methyltransferase [Rhizobium sp. SAFR-030]|uniref:class I SAM-dependent methyltransferase n=1 Tax=Rhizobium sp. SAFR-030 TaxID=3387277 RepID=UPI003F7F90EB
MPVDDAFSRRGMAILYDSFNAHGADRDFYLDLAVDPSRILDIGCGTGLLTLALAARGHDVTGVDPAAGMLSVARDKDEAGLVRWIKAGADQLELPERFDLAIMTAHVFQVFLDDRETSAALTNIHRHLGPGGRLVFESRNPDAGAYNGWTQERTRQTEEVPGIGPVEVFYQVRERDGEHITFDAVFTLLETGERRISESTLRFAPKDKIVALVEEAGFRIESVFGDWDRSSFGPASPEIIVISAA